MHLRKLWPERAAARAEAKREGEQLSEDQAVEFCILVGHYVMVAGTINTLGVRLEPGYLKKVA